MPQKPTRTDRRHHAVAATPEAVASETLASDLVPPDPPSPGELVLVTGASGAGKTTLLRRWAWSARRGGNDVRWCPSRASGGRRVLNRFDGGTGATLAYLARFGLADAALRLQTSRTLSDGQRHRLALAEQLWPLMRPRVAESAELPFRHVPGRATLVLIDEFAEPLDTVSALGLACALRRAVDASGRAARWGVAVATWRGELSVALRPHRWYRADFGRLREVLPSRPAGPPV